MSTGNILDISIKNKQHLPYIIYTCCLILKIELFINTKSHKIMSIYVKTHLFSSKMFRFHKNTTNKLII